MQQYKPFYYRMTELDDQREQIRANKKIRKGSYPKQTFKILNLTRVMPLSQLMVGYSKHQAKQRTSPKAKIELSTSISNKARPRTKIL